MRGRKAGKIYLLLAVRTIALDLFPPASTCPRPIRCNVLVVQKTLIQHNKPEHVPTVFLPLPEQPRAPVLEDLSVGAHPKIHLAAPAQEAIVGAGEFQNLLADRAYREPLHLPVSVDRIINM